MPRMGYMGTIPLAGSRETHRGRGPLLRSPPPWAPFRAMGNTGTARPTSRRSNDALRHFVTHPGMP